MVKKTKVELKNDSPTRVFKSKYENNKESI